MPTMEAGTHVARIVSTAIGTTKKGEPQVLIRFENDHGEHITWYGYFSHKALPYTLERLKTCGWDAVANGNDVSSLHQSEMLVGNQVELVCEEEEYEGKPRVRVQWINSLGSTLSIDEARDIGAKVKGVIERDGGAPDLDDIPF